MTNDDALLTGERLRTAFALLAEILTQKGATADIFVFGGAAMVLGYDARPSTRDVDALWRPHGAVLHAAWEVAEQLGLPRWWLNEQASSYVPPGTPLEGAALFEAPGLRVVQASPELLLAMKVAAARSNDLDDIRFLAETLGYIDSSKIIAHAERVLGQSISDRKRMIVEDLFPSHPII